MTYLLAGINGEHKGRIWPISTTPLTFGRDPESNIVLSSLSISRRHCQFVVRDESMLIEDLGCRNLPLVNGRPVRFQTLHAGDEISLGREQFVVAAYADDTSAETRETALLPKTVAWERMDRGEGTSTPPLRPRTVQDLALLYEAVCDFSSHTDPRALLGVVQQRIITYFNPEAVWIARGDTMDQCSMWTCESASDKGVSPLVSPPAEPRVLMSAALEQRRALLERSGAPSEAHKEVLTFAAPVLLNETPLAMLAVRAHSSREVHPDGGLQFLALLAHSLAPILYAAQHYALLHQDNERLRLRMNESHTIIGGSDAMRRLRLQASQAAKSSINVLITGETGVGKELVARVIHDFSSRKEHPMVIVNCAAIPRELFESELFGHIKGAYKGASSSEPGLLVRANGGTLFLDEIGGLSLENQARILRVVENHTFRPVGSTKDVQVDVRFVAATNKDLVMAVQRGRFREDLYHRIRGLEIAVPPLSKHPEDIPELATHFLQGLRDEGQRLFQGFAPGAFDTLQDCDWPGNVRELRHAIHRAMTYAKTDVIQVEDILDELPVREESSDAEYSIQTLDEVEKQHIVHVLQQCGGNVRLAAQAMGISRTTLYNKISSYKIGG